MTSTRLYCVDWFSNQESEFYGKNDIFLCRLELSSALRCGQCDDEIALKYQLPCINEH